MIDLAELFTDLVCTPVSKNLAYVEDAYLTKRLCLRQHVKQIQYACHLSKSSYFLYSTTNRAALDKFAA